MGTLRRFGPRSAGLLALVGLGGCQVAEVRAWNLEQVHTPEGRPKGSGRLRSDAAYFVASTLGSTHFRGLDLDEHSGSESEIEDPLGTCFENVLALARCPRDERNAGLQAACFAWLGVDCTYPLSRERCLLALGELAQDLRVGETAAFASGEPAGPESVRAVFDGLVASVRAYEADELVAASELERACQAARGLALDRPGGVRLLRAANALLEGVEEEPGLAPLRALRLDLARHVTTLALRASLADPNGRVRAAGLEANLRAFPPERAERLRWALSAPMADCEEGEEVSLRALEFLARYGLPSAPEGTSEADFLQAWRALLGDMLRLQIDGPHTVAACRALARIEGAPEDLRPEHWLAHLRAEPGAQPRSAEPAADDGG